MKKLLNIILFLAVIPMYSCEDWLDVTSETQIFEEDLFSSGDGYRQALNGIYTLMGESSLYGRELTWGLSSVLSDVYYGYDIYGNTAIDEYYEDLCQYSNPWSDDMIDNTYDPIWTAAYKTIANCNNLLAYAEVADSTIFKYGKTEQNLIIGEAKAARALMHFEILRLFGYAMHEDGATSEKRLPYVKDFYTVVPEYYTTPEMLEFIIEDFEDALALLKDYDLEYVWVFDEYSHDQHTTNNYPDMFMGARGARLNYLAVCILTARAYMFALDYDTAYDYAEIVYNYGPHGTDPNISFDSFSTYSSYASNTAKFEDEILFCFYNDEFILEYESFLGSDKYLRIYKYGDWFGSDTDDYRYSRLFSSSSSTYYGYSNRWTTEGNYETRIPVIRLSEAYHTMAECLARVECSKYNLTQALYIMDQFRFDGRNVNALLASSLADASATDVLSAIWNDYCRESMEEGRISWMYKRTDQGLEDLEGQPLPIPLGETDYLGL